MQDTQHTHLGPLRGGERPPFAGLEKACKHESDEKDDHAGLNRGGIAHNASRHAPPAQTAQEP